jgi:hypothetical protein
MENDARTTDPAEAAAQLAALRAGREQVADRARQPWWYDPALGLFVFVLFAGLATRSIGWTLGAIVVFAAGMRLLVVGYRRATGFWVNGMRSGRTRRAIAVWLAVYAVVVVPAFVLLLAFDVHWPMVVAGAILGVTIALVSRWWTTIYIRELREER